MQNSNFIRSAGLWCIVGAVIATVGAIVTATIPSTVPVNNLSYPFSPPVFVATEILWTISHVLMFIGVLGIARSGAVGNSMVGRVGLWIASIGMAAVAVAELGFAFFPNATMDNPTVEFIDNAIGMATMVAAIGLVLAGIAVLRTRHWHGWHAFTPLLCGLFVFAVFLPVLITQPDLFLWGIAGWSACFIPLGFALYQQGATATTTTTVTGSGTLGIGR